MVAMMILMIILFKGKEERRIYTVIHILKKRGVFALVYGLKM